MALLDRLREAARRLKRELAALVFVARDPRTPWHAKLLLALILAYAASPIDLIPDFVPLLGYVDDLLLLPLGIWLSLRLIPPQVMIDARAKADRQGSRGKADYRAAVVIVLVWLGAAWLLGSFVGGWLDER